MNKFSVVSILLLVVGLLFFGVAAYCFRTIGDMQETFGYYGIREVVYLSDAETASMFLKLKFGIVKFSILGVISWMLAIIFFTKRKVKK